MKTSAIALTLLLSQYSTVIVDGQLANAPIKRTRALSSTTTDNNIISSSKQQQRITRLLKTKRRRDNKARLLEDGSMSLATTDSMSMSVSLEPDVKDMFAAADSAEKGVESEEVFGTFDAIIPTYDAKAEKMAKAEKHSKAAKLFKDPKRRTRALREEQVPIKHRVSPADRFSSGRNLQEVDGSMSLATETSMSFLIEPEVKADMFAAAGDGIEATTVEFVEPIFPVSAKVFKSKTSKSTSGPDSAKAEKVADAKAEKDVDSKAEKDVDSKSSKVYSEKTVDRRRHRRHL